MPLAKVIFAPETADLPFSPDDGLVRNADLGQRIDLANAAIGWIRDVVPMARFSLPAPIGPRIPPIDFGRIEVDVADTALFNMLVGERLNDGIDLIVMAASGEGKKLSFQL